jgi:hypothetical protein
VALPETEAAWLDATRGKTLRELETLVASKAPGGTPDAPATGRPRPRVLRFEVAADTFATFREAKHRLQRSAGGGLDDDAVLLAMARLVLGVPCDEGAVATRFRSAFAASVAAVCSQREASSCRSTRRSSTWPPATRSTSASSSPHRPALDRQWNANLDGVPTDVAEGHSLDGATEPNGAQITTTRQSSNHVHVGNHKPARTDAPTDPSVPRPPARRRRREPPVPTAIQARAPSKASRRRCAARC